MKHTGKSGLWFMTICTFALLLMLPGCVEIPGEGSLAPDINYRNRKQYAISGLELSIGEFLTSRSTLPIHFEIAGVSETNGGDVSPLKDVIKVVRYKEPVIGDETPEELALKSELVDQPAVTINSNTGRIEVLEGNSIPAGEYRFDIRVTNTSGSRVLKDAIIIEFVEFDVLSFSQGMEKKPEIERIGETPHQIRFVGFLDGKQLSGDGIDFTQDRHFGFKGTFNDDTQDGEIWNVKFPVKSANTTVTWKTVKTVDGEEQVIYESEKFDFVLGIPGSYVIKLYK